MSSQAGDGSSATGLAAAFFDVDGTLASSNVVYAYLDFRLQGLPLWRRWGWLAFFLPRLPYYAAIDRLSRSWFNRAFFRRYASVDLRELERWSQEAVEGFWQPRFFPEALEEIRTLRAQACLIVLVAGGIEPVLKPLARWLGADALACAEVEVMGDRLTGRLIGGAMSGKAKADATRRIAGNLGINLEISYAYSDSYSDRPFLESVGHPIAVNPDWRLRWAARKRGWPIRVWGGSHSRRRSADGWRHSHPEEGDSVGGGRDRV